MQKPHIAITVAISKEKRAIGLNGKLLWHIKEDLKRFKQLTLGHPVIMGRKTFDSIVSYIGGPLPGRTNIVVTRSNICIDGCLVYHSLEEALTAAKAIETEEVHIGGGSDIYNQVLPQVTRLYLTIIDDEPPADTFFPDYSEFTKVIEREEHPEHTPPYIWLTLERES